MSCPIFPFLGRGLVDYITDHPAGLDLGSRDCRHEPAVVGVGLGRAVNSALANAQVARMSTLAINTSCHFDMAPAVHRRLT